MTSRVWHLYRNGRATKFSAAAASLVLTMLLAAACGGGSGATTQPQGAAGTSPTATSAAVSSGAATPASAGGEITVVMKDNHFEPKQITVAVGQAVVFELKNQGTAIHNMDLPGEATGGKAAVGSPLSPGSDEKLTATFPKAGTFQFVCDFHKPEMAGTINVR